MKEKRRDSHSTSSRLSVTSPSFSAHPLGGDEQQIEGGLVLPLLCVLQESSCSSKLSVRFRKWLAPLSAQLEA